MNGCYSQPNVQYCGNRLPCGLCRLTNSFCPLMQKWEITCTGTTGNLDTTIQTNTPTVGGEQ